MPKLERLLNEHKFEISRMIAYSKSTYRKKYPKNKIIFNANIISEREGKVWWGDLDLTLDQEKLQKVADAYNEPFYVLREMDCRFDTEKLPFSVLKKAAVKSFSPNNQPHPAQGKITWLQSLASKAIHSCFGKKKQ